MNQTVIRQHQWRHYLTSKRRYEEECRDSSEANANHDFTCPMLTAVAQTQFTLTLVLGETATPRCRSESQCGPYSKTAP